MILIELQSVQREILWNFKYNASTTVCAALATASCALVCSSTASWAGPGCSTVTWFFTKLT